MLKIHKQSQIIIAIITYVKELLGYHLDTNSTLIIIITFISSDLFAKLMK